MQLILLCSLPSQAPKQGKYLQSSQFFHFPERQKAKSWDLEASNTKAILITSQNYSKTKPAGK